MANGTQITYFLLKETLQQEGSGRYFRKVRHVIYNLLLHLSSHDARRNMQIPWDQSLEMGAVVTLE